MLQAVLYEPLRICQIHIFSAGKHVVGHTKGSLSDDQIAAYERAIVDIRRYGFREAQAVVTLLEAVGFKVLIV